MTDGVVDLATRAPQQQAPEFERTPPQDIAAEQSVLGGMLLSKDAIADVVEVVRSTDFYRPAHQTIFDTVVDLYGKGEPADPITVSAELTRLGEIGRIGGAPYLHTLMSSVPTAANAGYYARIVAEQAILRRLVEAGTRIVQLGYGTGMGDVDEVVDRAQQAIYDVSERRSSEDYMLLEELMQPTMDELEAIGSRGGSMSGVPTGFADLDSLTNGLHPGQLIVIAARPGIGKALALDTPLATPSGWTTMGDVAVGDQLLGADGRPTRVVAATDVMVGRPCFDVELSDGTVLVADADHQWVTTQDGTTAVRTTEVLAADARRDRAAHVLPVPAAVELDPQALPVDPYVVGARLAAADPFDPELAMLVEGCGGSLADVLPTSARQPLPPAYLRGSTSQRADLLAGLLDAAGVVAADGRVELDVASPAVVRAVVDLAAGLGHLVVSRPLGGGGARLVISAQHDLFRLASKALLHKERRQSLVVERHVVDVRPVPSVPVRCVEVDNADHLYLAGQTMVPTHNSTLGLDIARSCSVKNGMTSAIFSLEMSRTEITMRLLSAEARVPLHHMRAGTMTDDDWARLARRMGEVAEAPLFIDDSPNLSMMEIRAKARRLRQRHDLRLVVVDYLQLMSGNKKAESRQQEVSELSRNLKLLAKELEVPVIAMSQLNRGPEQRTDKKPMLSDLRESGCLPASTKVLRADTGAETTLGELHALQATDVPVWSLDDSLRYVRRHLTHVFSTGTKDVFRLVLASGKSVRATANHPFLTSDGWTRLDALVPGAQVAVPRHVPAPDADVALSDEVLDDLVSRATDGDADLTDVGRVPKAQLRAFLRSLWERAGTLQLQGPRVELVSTPRVAEQVARLLLRFGISVEQRASEGLVVTAVVEVADQKRFLAEIARAVAEELPFQGGAPHTQVWQSVRTALQAPAALGRVAAVLERNDLRLAATNDVLWDEVVTVEPDGREEVFDATVVGTHNFVADGIAVHNSIEQDADMVVLLHREDAYEKESPRAGEADFIVAKHRNGPTNTITVAFQGHYSRFVDMSAG